MNYRILTKTLASEGMINSITDFAEQLRWCPVAVDGAGTRGNADSNPAMRQ
jgi:hypothetical protein